MPRYALLVLCLHSLLPAQELDPSARASELFDAGDLAAAESVLRQALANATSLNAKTAAWRLDLASLLEARGDFHAAQPLLDEAIALLEKDSQAKPELLPDSLQTQGVCLVALGDWKTAERAFLRAIALYENRFGKQDVRITPALENLSILYIELGRLADAASLLQRSHELKVKYLPSDDRAMLMDAMAFGRLEIALGRLDRAVKHLERARALALQKFGPKNLHLARTLSLLGFANFYLRQFSRAEANWRQSLAIGESSKDPLRFLTALEMAQLFLARQDWRAAQDLVQSHLAAMQAAYGPAHTTVAQALDLLGRAQLGLRNLPEAERLFTESLQLFEASWGPKSHQTATVHHDLALAYMAGKRFQSALSHFDAAISTVETVLGPAHPDLAIYLADQAKCLNKLGQNKAARAAGQRSSRIQALAGPGDSAHKVDIATLRRESRP